MINILLKFEKRVVFGYKMGRGAEKDPLFIFSPIFPTTHRHLLNIVG